MRKHLYKRPDLTYNTGPIKPITLTSLTSVGEQVFPRQTPTSQSATGSQQKGITVRNLFALSGPKPGWTEFRAAANLNLYGDYLDLIPRKLS